MMLTIGYEITTIAPADNDIHFYVAAGQQFDVKKYATYIMCKPHAIDPFSAMRIQDAVTRLKTGEWLRILII